ncbi:MAG: metallophosphoesterase family protein [Bacteroidales bacterium]|nr:metallophosphoesterase family protein [Bacteroidales bacterium]
MKKIGLLSDTHGWLNPAVFEFFKDCDEIWHVGDIGSTDVADALSAFKPLRAVYGNIDDQKIRLMFPKVNIFTVENVKVMMTHIGGYPERYEPGIKELIIKEKPNVFISGHSHILKVMNDHSFGLLHINPGAAGNSGFHKVITMVRFQIDGSDIRNMELYEKTRN